MKFNTQKQIAIHPTIHWYGCFPVFLARAIPSAGHYLVNDTHLERFDKRTNQPTNHSQSFRDWADIWNGPLSFTKYAVLAQERLAISWYYKLFLTIWYFYNTFYLYPTYHATIAGAERPWPGSHNEYKYKYEHS